MQLQLKHPVLPERLSPSQLDHLMTRPACCCQGRTKAHLRVSPRGRVDLAGGPLGGPLWSSQGKLPVYLHQQGPYHALQGGQLLLRWQVFLPKEETRSLVGVQAVIHAGGCYAACTAGFQGHGVLVLVCWQW